MTEISSRLSFSFVFLYSDWMLMLLFGNFQISRANFSSTVAFMFPCHSVSQWMRLSPEQPHLLKILVLLIFVWQVELREPSASLRILLWVVRMTVKRSRLQQCTQVCSVRKFCLRPLQHCVNYWSLYLFSFTDSKQLTELSNSKHYTAENHTLQSRNK
jgi:hypothetical protein